MKARAIHTAQLHSLKAFNDKAIRIWKTWEENLSSVFCYLHTTLDVLNNIIKLLFYKVLKNT